MTLKFPHGLVYVDFVFVWFFSYWLTKPNLELYSKTISEFHSEQFDQSKACLWFQMAQAELGYQVEEANVMLSYILFGIRFAVKEFVLWQSLEIAAVYN